jgi:transcriptional regulator with XRE-family HTH domain
MRNDDEQTFSRALGANIKARRQQLGLTQDQAAALLRRVGLDVSRSWIAALERGSGRTLDLGEVALVCVALESDLSILLAGSGHVRVSDSATIAIEKIRDVLEAGSAALSDDDLDVPITREAVLSRSGFSALKRRNRRLWPNATPAEIVEAERSARGDVELRAAKHIGVEPSEVSVAAFGRWGHSLTEERDARVLAAVAGASPRTAQALRGHVTRQLIAELEPIVRKGS